MAVANFEELCKGLCELAGAASPDLAADDSAGVAITVEVQGVKVVLAQFPEHLGNGVLIRAIFGQLPETGTLAACRALMGINCQVHCMGYAFARNPVTKDIILEREVPLEHTSPIEMYKHIVSMAEGILGWRKHGFTAEILHGAA